MGIKYLVAKRNLTRNIWGRPVQFDNYAGADKIIKLLGNCRNDEVRCLAEWSDQRGFYNSFVSCTYPDKDRVS